MMTIGDIVIAGIILMVLWYCRDVILIAGIVLVGLVLALLRDLMYWITGK